MVHIPKKVLKKKKNPPDSLARCREEIKTRMDQTPPSRWERRVLRLGCRTSPRRPGSFLHFSSEKGKWKGHLHSFIKEIHLTFGENLLCPKYIHTCQFISFSQYFCEAVFVLITLSFIGEENEPPDSVIFFRCQNWHMAEQECEPSSADSKSCLSKILSMSFPG